MLDERPRYRLARRALRFRVAAAFFAAAERLRALAARVRAPLRAAAERWALVSFFFAERRAAAMMELLRVGDEAL